MLAWKSAYLAEYYENNGYCKSGASWHILWMIFRQAWHASWVALFYALVLGQNLAYC